MVCHIRLHLVARPESCAISQEPSSDISKLHPLHMWPSLHRAIGQGTSKFVSDTLIEKEDAEKEETDVLKEEVDCSSNIEEIDCSSNINIPVGVKISNAMTAPTNTLPIISSHLEKTNLDTKERLHSKPKAVSVLMCTVCNKEFKTRPMLDLHASTCWAQVSGGKGRVIQKFISSKETAFKEKTLQEREKYEKDKANPVLYYRTSAGPEIRQFKKKLHIEEGVHQKEHKTKGEKCKERQEKYALGSKPPIKPVSETNMPAALGKRYKCHFCQEIFCSMKKRRKHGQDTHTKPECDSCNKSFKTMNQLKVHYKLVHDRKLIPCDICGKVLKGKESVEMHKLSQHEEEGRFQCEVCGKQFLWKTGLKCHARTHTGEKPYQCTICGKAFPFSSSLLVHKQRHASERKFKCTVCNMSYTTEAYLDQHMKRHDPKNHVQCPFCLKMFKSKASFTVHKMTHTNERKYQCDICGSSYNLPSSFWSHKKKHMEASQVGEKGPKKRGGTRVAEQPM